MGGEIPSRWAAGSPHSPDTTVIIVFVIFFLPLKKQCRWMLVKVGAAGTS
jgi:hypothetical protein